MQKAILEDALKSYLSCNKVFFSKSLFCALGTKYFYTTFGWTLISAAVEGASKETFPVYLNKVLRSIGMNSTVLDENDPIIYHRTRWEAFLFLLYRFSVSVVS